MGTSAHAAPQSGMLDAALAAARAGLNVLPPREDGTKAPIAPDGTWERYQTQKSTGEELAYWYGPCAGLGIVCGITSGNLELFEFDDTDVYCQFKELAQATALGELVERLETGYVEQTPRQGYHWFYRCEEIAGNTKLAQRLKRPEEMVHPNDRVKVLIETRGQGGFAVVAPSHGHVHPSGKPYSLLRGSFATIRTITPGERTALWDLARTFDQMPKAEAPAGVGHTWREATGARPGDDFNQRADWRDLLERHGWCHVFERGGVQYYRRPGKDRGVSATVNRGGSNLLYVFSTSTPFESERGYSKFSAYGILEHGGDYTAAATALSAHGYGNRPMMTAPDNVPWPAPLDADAFHGLAGDVVAAIRPHTEADDAALLINFLEAFGNAVGREPHAVAEADRHGINLFAVLVGETAKGRKGSSWGHVRELFTRADPTWAGDHVVSGLSSGEGLIWAVRNPIEHMIPVKDKSRPTGGYETIVEDQGVDDKRLLVVESEFASPLRTMERNGNTLSPTIRQAWDTGDLRTLTKNTPARATGAHVSIIGHVTKGELLRYLNDIEAGNGFANRILWVCTQRARVLPEGGGTPSYGPLVERLHTALERGRGIGRLERDALARQLWAEVYPELSDGKPGLLGAVVARAEAQVLRLSLLYAVLDGADAIGAAHLKAALAVWEYCEASARYIFGDATGDPVADQILRALRMAGELTRTAISTLFNRNVAAARIEHALRSLGAAGLARSELRPPPDGSGRPSEVWRA